MGSFGKTPSIITSFLVLILLLAPASDAAISCSNVISNLRPCLSYLQSGGGTPSGACCGGAKALAASATTAADKQTACSCLKTASSSFKVNPGAAKALPKTCGISLPFEMSPNVDCSKIN